MVEDVFFRKSTRTFFSDRLRRTFWWNFDEFNNHAPDMPPDERARHKQLVMDLKLKISDQPERRHYIKQGQIVTVDKT